MKDVGLVSPQKVYTKSHLTSTTVRVGLGEFQTLLNWNLKQNQNLDVGIFGSLQHLCPDIWLGQKFDFSLQIDYFTSIYDTVFAPTHTQAQLVAKLINLTEDTAYMGYIWH